MNDHEVISAFLDHEPFDPDVLVAALAEPEGRALLIDLIALRALAQTDDARLRTVVAPRRDTVVRFAVAATVAAVALFTGYQLGQRPARPPEPTAVISAGTDWQAIPNGGLR